MRDGAGGAQSVLVLGGASDIALATVRRLVADRCRRVVLAGRPSAALDAAAETVRGDGAEVEVVAFDAADTVGHPKVIGDVFATGDIDVVILAFGVLGDQVVFDEDHAAAVDAVTVNYTGAVSAGLAVADCLRAQGHGTLVVLSSVAGVRVRKDNFVYGSTKAGLDGFAQGLGDALQGSGARVMVVRPGFVTTKMTEGMDPAPFSTTAEKVAADIENGLRRGSHTVWSPAVLQAVFGVLRLVPRPLWRRLAAR
ncbi:decaprenylphospho-beta-D-erythro-pentofuranosid-2-ulose 2-reductase [Iamia sp. SCSIO 61187]|uniref:decaprenylphospho-beta-D-erythro-pentofuranosid- 2-ulose 2-reductase n=1 Tax=Iamia sp. SCSIO 61187 TaxID=2722752 RepID=UPI001C62BBB2|nr:decaprenylphospho-beta-D-erythro-pentofuranosid-2-ulose 2-reductase [Iamia sp. SCSIO 61187]QYG92657.1 decaprenylphospho-beta-D-erythro-pentofuranosid-2-ulose 2-reductase [Iamia sp. SCSIO 61187]